jgi:hypothetical protein
MVMRVPRGGPTSPMADDMAFFHVHCLLGRGDDLNSNVPYSLIL